MEPLGFDSITVLKYLKALGMNQKQCHEVPYQLRHWTAKKERIFALYYDWWRKMDTLW